MIHCCSKSRSKSNSHLTPESKWGWLSSRDSDSGFDEDHAHRLSVLPTASVGAQAVGAQANGALAIGTLVLASVAVGALAVGAIAIGRLAIGRARIRRLEIDELVVRQLRITEQLQTPAARLSAGAGKAQSQEQA